MRRTARSAADREFELVDTGIFAENRYFDVVVEYAKASTDDVLRLPEGVVIPLRVRSIVGLIPLCAVEVIGDRALNELPDFRERMCTCCCAATG